MGQTVRSGRRVRRAVACTTGAVLAVGVAALPASAAPPSAPPQPTVVAGNEQITVTFVAPPSDGGSPITRYAATCTSSDGGVPGDDNNIGAVAPITVLGLTNGKTYTCTVHAENDDGASPESLASLAVIPSTVPSAPVAPSVVAGNAQISVTFGAPFDGGRPITGFAATCSSSNGGVANTIPGAGSPIVVTGLSNGKTYTCTVHANNVNGAGIESAASAAVVPVSVPDTPAAPSVAPGHTQIQVIFPAPFNNGSPITVYTAICVSSNGGVPGAMVGVSSPITVSALTNGNTYTCTLAATNALGSSDTSPSSVAVIPAQRPDPPAQATVVPGNARITVSFTPPADNGHPIAGYTARCASSNGGVTRSLNGGASPITVTGLTNAKTYTCTVSATNLLGAGPPSTPSVAVIPATVPAPPLSAVATSGNGSLRVSFAPNNNNGRPITSYTATCASSNGGITSVQTGASSPITVGFVNNGKSYTCTVRATNSIGLGPPSAATKPIVVGQPGAPSLLAVASGNAPASTGSLKVSFHAGPANASAIDSYRATCKPVTTGLTRSATSTASPIAVTGVLTSHAYSCSVTATNAIGTSVASGALKATVGTPTSPKVLSILALRNGIALPFAAAVNNGKAITNYRARCTSINGGASSSPVKLTSPIVATNLTGGKTYSCNVTAINARGESSAAKAGPIVVRPPLTPNLANCTGHLGSLRVTPGLSPSIAVKHTFNLDATFGACTGPYVRGARVAMSFKSASAFGCNNAVGKFNSGSGTITWTAPAGLGGSSAAVQFVLGSTSGHTTTATFSGSVTSQANIFTNAFISGTVTLAKGVHAAPSGDCSGGTLMTSLPISNVTMTLS